MLTKFFPSTHVLILALLCGAAHAAYAQSAPVASAKARAKPVAAPSAAPATAAVAVALPPVALEKMVILALGQTDGRAVISLPDRQMAVVKVGDTLPRSTAVLMQVLPDKLMLEEVVPGVPGKQVVWMHKGQGAAPGRVERLSSVGAPPAEVALAPTLKVLTMPKGTAATPSGTPRKQ